MIGQTLSHYRIVEKIGAGGMGEVYRAYDERLERDVALKVLPAGTLADDAARKRFRREALALSKLNHPNIQTVFDFDTQEGVDFLVTEYVAGASLDEKLAAGALPEKEIAHLGMQLAEGLAAAHAERVIHRDLKPSNLRLTPDGRLKILDFGLAKLVRPAETSAVGEGPTQSASLTQAVVGTLPYMAPEQLRGEAVDARTDLYAAGVVLYEMATGRRPFEERLVSALTDAILHQPPPPPGRLKHDLSARLEEIILKCLEKEPGNRYQSAKELLVDLRRLAAPSPLPIAPSPQAPAWGRVLQRPFALAAVALVAVVAVLIGLNLGGLRDHLLGRAGPPRIQSLAVLPLKNLMGDPEQDYFVEGMHEALITELSKISALKVISRTSTMRYKDTDKPLPRVARDLGVDGVIEGSVLREGDQVRITVQLIHGPTDRHLWAQSFDRELRGILNLQSEVARTIAGEIQVKVSPQEQTHLATARPVNPEAYEAYLKGRHFWKTRITAEGLQKALEYFETAIQIDPSYALGYTGVADTYYVLGSNRLLTPQGSYPKARAAARKALELDENLAEAHTTMASVLLDYDWDWLAAQREFNRALELNPGYAIAHHWQAFLLCSMGRHPQAIAAIRKARSLDPLSPRINANVGLILYFARQYDQAIQELDKALELFPDDFATHVYLGLTFLEVGLPEKAIAELRRSVTLQPGYTTVDLLLASAYARTGKRQEAKKIIETRLKARMPQYVPPYFLAKAYTGLGEKDQAIAWLEKAYADRNPDMPFLRADPGFDFLRSDPRFQALLRRMNFPQ